MVVAVFTAVLLSGAALPVDNPLLDAARRGEVEVVRSLLDGGADVNAARGDGLTALHAAAERGHLDVAGPVTAEDLAGRTALAVADIGLALVQLEAEGLQARVFQHEVDHLDGTIFVNRLQGITRDLIVRRVRKLQRAGKW